MDGSAEGGVVVAACPALSSAPSRDRGVSRGVTSRSPHCVRLCQAGGCNAPTTLQCLAECKGGSAQARDSTQAPRHREAPPPQPPSRRPPVGWRGCEPSAWGPSPAAPPAPLHCKACPSPVGQQATELGGAAAAAAGGPAAAAAAAPGCQAGGGRWARHRWARICCRHRAGQSLLRLCLSAQLRRSRERGGLPHQRPQVGAALRRELRPTAGRVHAARLVVQPGGERCGHPQRRRRGHHHMRRARRCEQQRRHRRSRLQRRGARLRLRHRRRRRRRRDRWLYQRGGQASGLLLVQQQAFVRMLHLHVLPHWQQGSQQLLPLVHVPLPQPLLRFCVRGGQAVHARCGQGLLIGHRQLRSRWHGLRACCCLLCPFRQDAAQPFKVCDAQAGSWTRRRHRRRHRLQLQRGGGRTAGSCVNQPATFSQLLSEMAMEPASEWAPLALPQFLAALAAVQLVHLTHLSALLTPLWLPPRPAL